MLQFADWSFLKALVGIVLKSREMPGEDMLEIEKYYHTRIGFDSWLV
jgi:hypothetical protein